MFLRLAAAGGLLPVEAHDAVAESPTMPESPRIPFWAPLSLGALALLGLIAFTLAFVPLRSSHDEWWHLKTGKWIDEQGLPENEIFTYTAEEYPWHNHEWLAQWGLWRIYRAGEAGSLGGVRAVILFKTLFFAATLLGFALFLGRRTGLPGLAVLAVAVMAALSRRTIYPRPPFITYGLLVLTLCLFIAWRDRKLRTRWLLSLPPLFALWTNLHGGWLAGLVLGGAFWLEAGADWALAAWRSEPIAAPRRRFLEATGLGVVCGLATLVNPYGYHLYALSGRVLSDERLTGIINEMLPPHWRFVWAVDGALVLLLFGALRPTSARTLAATSALAAGLFYLLQARFWFAMGPEQGLPEPAGWETGLRAGLAYALILVAGGRSKASIGLAQTLLALFFAQQALHHVRHLPLFGIALAPLLAQALADWANRSVGRWDALWRTSGAFRTASELQAALLPSRRCLLHRLGFTLTVLLGAFYLALPEEAVGLTLRQGKFVDRLAARALPDRNLLLLRGQDPAMNAVNEPGTEPGSYPKAAADFLAQSHLPGRLWNGGNYAGYLIWRLAPEHFKVFTDNRYDIYGGDFIQQQEIVLRAFEGDKEQKIPSWEEVLDHWDVHTLMIPLDAPVHAELTRRSAEARSRWKLIWAQDGQFAIWTRPKEEPRS